MQYPVKGEHFADLSLDRLIYATHDDTKVPQAFRIYKISKPLNGIVSVFAEHISYQLNRMIVMPFTASSLAGTLAGIETNVAGGVDGFVFWTDKSVVKSFKLETPQSVRSILAGQEGSILDVYGTGEYEFDMRTVKLYTNRGRNNGVVLRYGKNITNITADTDMTNTYTAIVPYWTNGEETVTLPEKILYASTQYAEVMANAVDLSGEFNDKPSVSQLRAKANDYLANNQGWLIKQNVKVDFVQLWQTEEYAQYAPLQRVRLCDIVNVIYEPLDIETTAEVVKVVYNVLLDRYDEIEIGEAQSTMSGAVADMTREATKDLPTKSFLEQSIERATEMITGGLGGYVCFHYDADGHPDELLVMDSPDIETAVNVWRWNKNGLGFSSTGYDGTYRLAITADGHIVADFIDTGYMSAERIRAGIMTALSGWVKFDLDAGDLCTKRLYFYDNSHNTGQYINNQGFHFWQNNPAYEHYQTGDYSILENVGMSCLVKGGAVGIHAKGGKAYVTVSTDATTGAGYAHIHSDNDVDFEAGGNVAAIIGGGLDISIDSSLTVTDGNGETGTAKSCHLWVTNTSGGQGRLDFVNGILTSFYNIDDN